MIKLNLKNLDVQTVGQENGIDLTESFKEYSPKIADIVNDIYGRKNTKGAWLDWLNLAYNEKVTEEIITYAESVKEKFMDVLIVGIGGSSLGPLAISEAVLKSYWNNTHSPRRKGYPRIFFLDNIDPDQVNAMLEIIILHKCLFNFITKSGTTAETMAAYALFKDKLEKRLGESYKENIVVTTDEHTGALRKIANEEGFKSFAIPEDVGGRFSVFSPVGLLPLALMGVDIKRIIQGVRDMDKIVSNPNIQENIAAQGALVSYLLDKKGKNIQVFMPYSYRLRYVADWFVQLWAESLGKAENLKGEKVHCGQTPVRALGAVDQHAQVQLFNEGPNNKMITFVRVKEFDNNVEIPQQFNDIESVRYLGGKSFNDLISAEADATAKALTNAHRPNMSIVLPKVDEYYIGQLLYLLEVQTAIAGGLYGIDPFNQPGVEMGKNYTYGLMGRPGYEKYAQELSLAH